MKRFARAHANAAKACVTCMWNDLLYDFASNSEMGCAYERSTIVCAQNVNKKKNPNR